MQDKQALQQICRQIAEEGLTPGVGLLRARAPFKISVAQAIEALKAYKNGKPAQSDIQHPESGTEPRALESRVQALEERVRQLEALLQEQLKHSG